MTRDEARQFLPIIQAFAEGEEVQSQNSDGTWSDVTCPTFRDEYQYRIKPKPREVWMVAPAGSFGHVFDSLPEAEEWMRSTAGYSLSKFREVLD